MSIGPPFRAVPKDVVEWGRFFRDAAVTVTDGTITDASFAPRDGHSVIGVSGGTVGQPASIIAASNGQFLGRRADVLGFFGIQDSDIPSTIARDTEVAAAQAAAEATAASALAGHVAAADPHPTYTTASELAAGIAAHEAAVDPHPTYTTAAEVSALLPVGANPSATAGLSAVNGSAATFMRSDGAPAISQSITPTWTATHIFTGDVRHVRTASGFELWKDATPSLAGGVFFNTFTSDLVSLGYYNGSWHEMWAANAATITYGNGTDLPAHNFVGTIGFNGTAAIAKPTVTGSRGGNAALASLLTELAAYGLITDSTTA